MTLHLMTLHFTLEHQNSQARAATLSIAGAQVRTPSFMPVGTQGSVKGLSVDEVASTGARIVLANTYHLWQRPGPDLVSRQGGLGAWTGWPHAILTDSGGFQAFSLATRCQLTADGFRFLSHLDGRRCFLSPEGCMQIQSKLGSHIAMILDVCPPASAPREEMARAVQITTHWAERCLAARAPKQSVFAIAQGGMHRDLRLEHLDALRRMPFDGFALGGFSVGEPAEAMHAMLPQVAPHMPADKARYLMGVGKPADLLHAVAAGVDLFDCVLPTRNARNGQALTWGGRVNLHQRRHIDDPRPLDRRCDCPVCRRYSRSYLSHLFRAREMLGPRLISQHNLSFYGSLMHAARQHILADRFHDWMAQTLRQMREEDEVASPDRIGQRSGTTLRSRH